MSAATQTLAETIVRCFATSQIDLHAIEPPFAAGVIERPTATLFTRTLAGRSSSVTNRLHESIPLDDFERRVLCGLDGTRDRAALAALLTEQVLSGDLVMHQDGSRLVEAAGVRQVIEAALPETLKALSRRALFVP
jgi:hypothetical protein